MVRVVLRDDWLARHERVVRGAITLAALARGVLTRRMIRGARYKYLLQVLRFVEALHHVLSMSG